MSCECQHVCVRGCVCARVVHAPSPCACALICVFGFLRAVYLPHAAPLPRRLVASHARARGESHMFSI